jgi:hypothetical protein
MLRHVRGGAIDVLRPLPVDRSVDRVGHDPQQFLDAVDRAVAVLVIDAGDAD